MNEVFVLWLREVLEVKLYSGQYITDYHEVEVKLKHSMRYLAIVVCYGS